MGILSNIFRSIEAGKIEAQNDARQEQQRRADQQALHDKLWKDVVNAEKAGATASEIAHLQKRAEIYGSLGRGSVGRK